MSGQRSYVVPYLGQGSQYGQAEVRAVSELLLSGRHLSDGSERDAFETEFAAYLGVPFVRTVTSCTVALAFATYLCDLQPGDEVICSSLTFQSTATALLNSPATVRFADIDPATLCMDSASLRSLLNHRTKAVFVTHYGGRLADMDAIQRAASCVNAIVIEDCAHALGSARDGRGPHLGAFGAWSFHSLKNISTLGQGGALSFHDPSYDDRICRLRAMEPDARYTERATPAAFGQYSQPAPVQGHERNAWTHDCQSVGSGGTNAIMSDPAAAAGRVQLRKLNQFVQRRRDIAGRLKRELSELGDVDLLHEQDNEYNSYHLFSFLVTERVSRDDVIRHLEKSGVEIILRYFPLHLTPEWRARGSRFGDCPNTERIWFQRLVNLPLYPSLTDDQVDFMIHAVSHALTASTT